MTSTTTTDVPTRNVANQKKRRHEWEYTDANVYIRTQFPGCSPRYLPLSGITDSSELFQACADLWPEYFSASAPYAYSSPQDPQKTTTQGLVGIAFYHPEIGDLVEISYHNIWDFWQLYRVVRQIVERQVMKLDRDYRISASGPFFVDLELVREGRETLRVAGYACTRNLVSRVMGMEEKREQQRESESRNKRSREVENEAEAKEDEEPRQRRRLEAGDN